MLLFAKLGSSWDSIATQIFESIEYGQLYKDNQLSYIDKLFSKFHKEYEFAKENGILQHSVSWLQVSIIGEREREREI